jgi:hypothetical protein
MQRLLGRRPRLERLWADGAYAGKLARWARRTAVEVEGGAPPSLTAYFPGAAPPLDGGTHLRLVGPPTALEQGL